MALKGPHTLSLCKVAETGTTLNQFGGNGVLTCLQTSIRHQSTYDAPSNLFNILFSHVRRDKVSTLHNLPREPKHKVRVNYLGNLYTTYTMMNRTSLLHYSIGVALLCDFQSRLRSSLSQNWLSETICRQTPGSLCSKSFRKQPSQHCRCITEYWCLQLLRSWLSHCVFDFFENSTTDGQMSRNVPTEAVLVLGSAGLKQKRGGAGVA